MDAAALAAAITQAKAAELHQMKEEAAHAIAAHIDALKAENARLRIALHDAIRRPMGVTPDSAVEFYNQRMADEAEARRSKGGRL